MGRREFLANGAKVAAVAAGAWFPRSRHRRVQRSRRCLTMAAAGSASSAWITSGSRCPTSTRRSNGSRTCWARSRRSPSGRSAIRPGTFMHDLLDVDRERIDRADHDAPNRSQREHRAIPVRGARTNGRASRNSDWSGHHIAFYVTDIDAAVEYMGRGASRSSSGRSTLTGGPAAGQTIQYFQTPCGSYIEFISYPDGMAYQVPSVKPLWSPKLNGTNSVVTKVPGLLGIDHIGITVPDVDGRPAWFEDDLGFINPLTFGPFSRPGRHLHAPISSMSTRSAVVEQIRMVRGGNGPNVELFQYTAPDQDQTFRKNSDWGGHHIAFYVRHIDKAVEYMQSKGVEKLLGPLPSRRPRLRPNDQLLQDAVRHLRRADQLPARNGVRVERHRSRSGTRATTTPRTTGDGCQVRPTGAILVQALGLDLPWRRPPPRTRIAGATLRGGRRPRSSDRNPDRVTALGQGLVRDPRFGESEFIPPLLLKH